MKITITLDTDNAVFQEYDQPGSEVARILRTLASKVNGVNEEDLREFQDFKLRDINGNTVGKVTIDAADHP